MSIFNHKEYHGSFRVFNSGQTWKSYSLDGKEKCVRAKHARSQSRVRTCSSSISTYAMHANCRTLRECHILIRF